MLGFFYTTTLRVFYQRMKENEEMANFSRFITLLGLTTVQFRSISLMRSAILCFLLMLAACSARPANLLVNGSFESYATGWTINPAHMYGFSGSPSLGHVPEGYWCFQNLSNPQSVSQTKAITPGLYTLELAGYYDIGTTRPAAGGILKSFTPGYISYVIVVDGNDVASWRVDSHTTPDGFVSGWQSTDVTWVGSVRNCVGVRIDMQASLTSYRTSNGIEETVRSFNVIDNISLQAYELVPEPSSILALLCGISGVGGMIWRRKK